ncbi:MAG: glycosyltransferase [Rubrobacteraceae bacterium]
MRIAFVNPHGNFDPGNSHLAAHPDFGGQLVYVREVARALSGLGHEVDILTRRIVDPEWPEFEGKTDSYPDFDNIRILRFRCGPDEFLPKEDLWPHLGDWVGRIAEFYRDEGVWPDLWTGHYADGGLCAALLEEESGVPFTFTGHSLGASKLDFLMRETGETNGGALAALDVRYRFGVRISAERAAMARATAIVTNSSVERYEQYSHAAYRDAAGEADERYAVIPPGVNPDIFGPETLSPWEDEVRKKIQASLERDIFAERRRLPAVIAWSRLDPKKNHLALVRAFAVEPALREKANLVMITRGLEDPLREIPPQNGGQREVIQTLVDEIDREDLWGSVSAFSLSGQTVLAALYRWGAAGGGVFCLPAEHEPFGMAVIEAMAVGLPVVATSNGGPTEITANGRAGLLADPTDPADIARQLLRLLDDRETWQAYAGRGLERVAKNYHWRRTAEGYLNLAKHARQKPPAPGGHQIPIPDYFRKPTEEGIPRLQGWTSSGPDIEIS